MIHTLDKTYKSPQSLFIAIMDGVFTIVPIDDDGNLLYKDRIRVEKNDIWEIVQYENKIVIELYHEDEIHIKFVDEDDADEFYEKYIKGVLE